MRQRLRESKHLKNTGEGETAGFEGKVPSAVVSILAGSWDGSSGALRGQERATLTLGWKRPRLWARSVQASSVQPWDSICAGTGSLHSLLPNHSRTDRTDVFILFRKRSSAVTPGSA